MSGFRAQPLRMEILLVEDNPADACLMKQAFLAGGYQCNLHVAEDGVEALAYLTQHGKYREATRPDLVVLDLNLPKLTGHEVLAQIKKDEQLKEIPVVVMTTSSNEQDLRESYNLHANCFITKPRELDDFTRIISALEDFWFHRALLPTGSLH